jgi:hypothetical protein
VADILYGFLTGTVPAILGWEFGKWSVRQARKNRGA